MTALLEVTGINKRFGGVHAVHNLSLTVADGEILGLIGPNGAGCRLSSTSSTVSIRLIGVGFSSKERTSPANLPIASLAAASPALTRSSSRLQP